MHRCLIARVTFHSSATGSSVTSDKGFEPCPARFHSLQLENWESHPEFHPWEHCLIQTGGLSRYWDDELHRGACTFNYIHPDLPNSALSRPFEFHWNFPSAKVFYILTSWRTLSIMVKISKSKTKKFYNVFTNGKYRNSVTVSDVTMRLRSKFRGISSFNSRAFSLRKQTILACLPFFRCIWSLY